MRVRLSRLLLAGALLAGCGGSQEELPPAAEPARAPAPERPAAGRVLQIGNGPEGLVADARTGLLAVGLRDPDRLALVDMTTLRTVRTVALPEAPRHLRLAAPGGPVLVPAERSDSLIEVSLPGGDTRVTEVGRFPHDAAGGGGRLFVGDELGDTLSVLENGRRVARLDAPIQPGGVAASTDGRRVAVVGVRARELELFDTRSLDSLGAIGVGVGPTHLIAAGGDRFFVVDTRGNGLLEVRTEPELRIHRRIALAGVPYGVASDPRRRRIWVTLTARNELIELTAHRRLRSFPTVRQPNTVAVDTRSGRVFVAGRTGGTLQVIDPPPLPPGS